MSAGLQCWELRGRSLWPLRWAGEDFSGALLAPGSKESRARCMDVQSPHLQNLCPQKQLLWEQVHSQCASGLSTSDWPTEQVSLSIDGRSTWSTIRATLSPPPVPPLSPCPTAETLHLSLSLSRAQGCLPFHSCLTPPWREGPAGSTSAWIVCRSSLFF